MSHGPTQTYRDRPTTRSIVEEGSSVLAGLSRLTRGPAFGSVIAAILVYVFFAIVANGSGFVSGSATASWLNTASQLGILSVPVALLLIVGEFDLSIGSMVPVGSIVVGIVSTHYAQPVWVAVVIALAIAVAVGLVNGLLVTRTKLPSFIVTLGANLVMAGLALALSRAVSGTTTLSVSTHGFWHGLFGHQFGQYYISILWWVLLVVLALWTLNRSRLGPWLLATGGNAEQARRDGVLTSRVKISLFICTSLAAVFVGMTQAVAYNTADAVGGQGYVFQVPTVVVIGGVLLTGGFGSILGVFAGTVLYGIISAGLFYTGWNTDLSQVVLGCLMIVAVLTNNQLRRLALASRRPPKPTTTTKTSSS